MKIDTSFNMYSDAGGGDPDSTSPTLKSYHQFLWSKDLPNGKKISSIVIHAKFVFTSQIRTW